MRYELITKRLEMVVHTTSILPALSLWEAADAWRWVNLRPSTMLKQTPSSFVRVSSQTLSTRLPIHMELLLDNENGVESLHTSETLDRSACESVGLVGRPENDVRSVPGKNKDEH